MKIVCLLGSPRRDGNSATIAKRFIETATSLGAEIRTFELNRLNYRGCQGCCACKTARDICVQKDDLTEVLTAIREKEADIYLLAFPVYGGTVPGQVKCFTDRCFSFMIPDYVGHPQPSRVPPGKKGVLIVTQGAVEEKYTEATEQQQVRMKHQWRLDEVHIIRACNVGPGGVPKGVPDNYLQQAEDVARALIT
ncbi:flavodoxin family protein [Chloroflexota bacterium]